MCNSSQFSCTFCDVPSLYKSAGDGNCKKKIEGVNRDTNMSLGAYPAPAHAESSSVVLSCNSAAAFLIFSSISRLLS